MYPRVLKELAAIMRPPSIIFERSRGFREAPQGWKKANTTIVFNKGKEKDTGNYRPVRNLGKRKRSLPGTISKYMKDRKVISISQHSLQDEVTGLVDEEKAVNIVYLNFSKSFDNVSLNIFTDKLTKYRLDTRTVRWIENWQNCWT